MDEMKNYATEVTVLLENEEKRTVDEYIETLEKFKDATGYREIEFSDLPDIIGGVTIPYIEPSETGVGIRGGEIKINDKFLEIPESEQNYRDFVETLFHEAVHLEDFRLESESDYGFNRKEREYKTILSEGLASKIGKNGYHDAERFYDMFYDEAEDYFYDEILNEKGSNVGEILEDISEDKYLVHVGLNSKENVYDFQMLDKEIFDSNKELGEEDIYEILDDIYQEGIDRDRSYLIDFRDEDVDSEKIAEHYLETHERVESNILDFKDEMDKNGYSFPNKLLPFAELEY